MASLIEILNKYKKLIISFLLFVLLGLFILSLRTTSSLLSAMFNTRSQDTHPEVIEWMAECDISGKGIFVLKLPWERADQFLFASVRHESQELPDDVFSAYIYINSFENDDIERVIGRFEIYDIKHSFVRFEIVRSTLRVFYQTKGIHEYLKDVLYDLYYDSNYLEDYDFDFDEYLYNRYINVPEQYISYFSGYELSHIHSEGIRITNLEIFINGEKVDFHVSMLD